MKNHAVDAWRRVSTIILALVLIAGPLLATAISADDVYDGEKQHVRAMPVATDGDMKNRTPKVVEYDEARVSKQVSHEPGQPEGEYTITLRTEGKSVPTEDTSDFVLVLDNSNSMGPKVNDNHTDRVAAANKAINSFLDLVQETNDKSNSKSAVRVSLVTFGSQVLNDHSVKTPTNNLSQIRNALPKNIPSDRGQGSLGGTNTQDALETAQNIIQTSTAQRKNIILLSDGAPTFSKKGLAGTDPEHMAAFGQQLGYGYFFTLYQKMNSSSYNQRYQFNGQWINTHGPATISQANLARQTVPGLKISSIGIQMAAAKSQNSSKSDTEEVLKKVANSEQDYYDAQDVDKMGAMLRDIFSSENTIKNGAIDDPMGDHVDLIDGSVQTTFSNPAFAEKVKVTAGHNHITANWLNLGAGDWVEIKYRIKIDTTSKNFEGNTFYDTNGRTTLTPTDGAPAKDFPIPQVSTYQGRVTLKKTGMSNDALAGATFELQQQDGDAWRPLGQKTTDSAGHVSWEKLTRGSYKLVETQAPKGYFVTADKKEQRFTLTDDHRSVDLQAANEKYGEVTVTKRDQAGQALAGAEFTLVDSQNQTVKNASGQSCVGTTDSNGQLTLKDLPYGKYTLKETKVPAGYFVSDDKTAVTVDRDHVRATYAIVNYHYGELTVTKTDSAGRPLAGAEFGLYDSKGQLVKDNQGRSVTGTSDGQGKVQWQGLPYGTYQLRETKAPKGYQKLAKDTSCQIDSQHVQLAITLKNEKQSHLPDTGGWGIWPWLCGGVVMLVGAAVNLQRWRSQ